MKLERKGRNEKTRQQRQHCRPQPISGRKPACPITKGITGFNQEQWGGSHSHLPLSMSPLGPPPPITGSYTREQHMTVGTHASQTQGDQRLVWHCLFKGFKAGRDPGNHVTQGFPSPNNASVSAGTRKLSPTQPELQASLILIRVSPRHQDVLKTPYGRF